MRTTTPLSITLTHEMADMVRAKVASGEYATESEVVRDGLRTLQARDAAVESWLRNEVARAYDAHTVDRTAVVPADKVMGRLRAARQKRISKKAV